MSQMHYGALFSRKLETFIFLALLRLFSAEEKDTTGVVLQSPACLLFDMGANDLRLRPAQRLAQGVKIEWRRRNPISVILCTEKTQYYIKMKRK